MTTFADRYERGGYAAQVFHWEAERRGWAVTDLSLETIIPEPGLAVLREIRADLSGADLILTNAVRAILADIKSARPRNRPDLIGQLRVTISDRALAGLEADIKHRRLPGYFAGEDAGWFMLTPQHVRSEDSEHRDGYWLVRVRSGIPIDDVLGPDLGWPPPATAAA